MTTFRHLAADENDTILIDEKQLQDFVLLIEDNYYRTGRPTGSTNLYIHNRVIGKTYTFSIYKADTDTFEYRFKFPDMEDFIGIKSFEEFKDLIDKVLFGNLED